MRSEDWGLIDYESSVSRQLELVEAVAQGAEDCVVVCSHPAVVTLGRASVSEDIEGWQGTTVEASRGGRATYHGPNQIVIYPILNLKNTRANVLARDIHSYLRALGEATVLALQALGLQDAQARTVTTTSASSVGDKPLSLTGVWVNDRKIASLGIAVRKWVTYHGVAVNIYDDEAAFKGIRPCGFDASVMTSLESEMAKEEARLVDRETVRGVFQETFVAYLK